MNNYVSEIELNKLINSFKNNEEVEPHTIIDFLERLDKERIMLRSMDREAAKYVESVICLRTDFDGETETGWKGLGAALTRALDERDSFRKSLLA